MHITKGYVAKGKARSGGSDIDSQKEADVRKLKICMFLPFPRYGENMRVAPQTGICSYLTNFGHKVTWIIWSENRHQAQPFFFNDVHVYTTPQIHYFPGHSVSAKILNKIPNTLGRMHSILKILREGNYDLIFARDGDVFDGLIAVYIQKRYKIPFVFELVNPLEQEWECWKIESKRPKLLYYLIAKFNALINVYIMKKADLVLTTTRWFEEGLAKKGIARSKLMPYPSGVDIASFLNKKGKNILEEYHLTDSKVIIYVGTMDKPRYLAVLIQAFSKVRETRENVKLLMVGEGSDKENLKRLAENLGLEGHVIFTGQVLQSKVPNFIAAADIGVSPVPPLSFYKLSSPIKMFEYMAMAKPVVANEEVFQHKEAIEQGGGGILVPFTSEAFAEAIIKLLDSAEKAAEIGQKGREWVVKNHSFEKLAKGLERAYYKVLKG